MFYTQLRKQSLKTFIGIAIIFFSSISYSQSYSAGIKVGGSYSLNDNGSEIFMNGQRYSAKSDFGYLGGGFVEINFGKLILRPEAFLNRSTGEFQLSPATSKYTVDKLSVPLLLGYNVYGPLDIYAGPAYQFIINKELENTREALEQEHNNFATQAGIKLNSGRWEIDLRYDFTLLKEHFQFVRFNNTYNTAYFDEGRLNQLMLSLNYKLFDSDIIPARRGKTCYF